MVSTHRIAGFGHHAAPADAVDRVPASSAASLEQLRTCSRELEGGALLVDGGGRPGCLIDVLQRRFGRVEPGPQGDPYGTVGQWHPYDHVFRDGNDVVIVPTAGGIRIRIRLPASPLG